MKDTEKLEDEIHRLELELSRVQTAIELKKQELILKKV